MGIGRRALLGAPFVIAGAASAQAPLPVVASFAILADIVARVGGARVRVTALAGPGQELHGFQPRPSDAQAVAAARVFVINGLGLEPWAERLGRAAGFKGVGVVASKGVKALVAGVARHGGGGKAHDHGLHDPHAWQDVANVRLYVANIRDGLIAADPAGAEAYRAGATAYLDRLAVLDADIKAAFLPIPRARRRIVTSHEALNYYADAYDLDILAPRGLSSEQDPSAAEVAALIGQMRRDGITALFLEAGANPALLRQVARDTGARIGATLYPDTLTAADGPAGSYEAMMRYNTARIVEALK